MFEVVLGFAASAVIGWYFYRVQKRDARSERAAFLAAPIDRKTVEGWPKIQNLPTAQTIIGRDDEVTRLAEMVEDKHIAAVVGKKASIAVARGPGGIGKTAMATEYARRFSKTYEGVWIVPSESDGAMHPSLAELGRELGCADQPDAKATALAAMRAVRDRGKHWLIVFDNAPDQNAIQPYLIDGPDLRFLITSRSSRWKDIAEYPVDVLDDAAALDLLQRESGRSDLDFKPLLEKLEGYPLALVSAGAWFAELGSSATVQAYIDDFDSLMKRELEDGSYSPQSDVPPSIYASLSLSITKLKPDARGLLNLCAVLAPDDIWPEMIEHGTQATMEGAHSWPPFVERIAENSALLRAAFADLVKASLLRPTEDGHSIHRLTQEVVMARLGGHATRRQDAAARMLNAGVPYAANEPTEWQKFARLAPHALRLLDTAPPSAAADRLFSQIGTYLQVRGDYPAAVRFLARSVEISETINGKDNALHALRLNNLAAAHQDNGDFEQAECLFLEAIRIDEAELGDHLQTATDLDNLGGLYTKQKRFVDAEPHMLRAEAITLTALGAHHPDYATSLSNLGVLYENWSEGGGDLQKRAQAADYNSRALKAARRAHGELHHFTATSLNNLAILRHRQGIVGEATSSMRRAIAIRLEILGAEHPMSKASVDSLAAILTANGADETAIRSELEKIPAEIDDVRRAHVAWGNEKLAEIAARHNLPSDNLGAVSAAVEAEATRQIKAGEPVEKHQWVRTEFNSAVFALQQGYKWGLTSPDKT